MTRYLVANYTPNCLHFSTLSMITIRRFALHSAVVTICILTPLAATAVSGAAASTRTNLRYTAIVATRSSVSGLSIIMRYLLRSANGDYPEV